ncbi:hypothetical protein NDI45_19310 [Leptolyngbya sp. GB1-A1]|uniref:hypothetical protein n=1 Tax=Leptolyngbya sp. GB1-A1 TaxID=2933908 RepID=UPI003297F117
MSNQDSYLDTEQIKQCIDFANKSWIYHSPHRLRERMPVEVWYDILQGKLSELTIYNFCINNRISSNFTDPPSFEVYNFSSKNESRKNSLHDLVINNRKKEVKSHRYYWAAVRLGVHYFKNENYIHGNPDDLVFLGVSLASLSEVKKIIQGEVNLKIKPKQKKEELPKNLQQYKTEEPQDKEKLNEILKQKYGKSLSTLMKIYKCSAEKLLGDELLKALVRDVDLMDVGYKAATTQTNSNQTENELSSKVKFTVLGEISVKDFLGIARQVEVGYVYGLPHDPLYDILLQNFLHFIKDPEERIRESAFYNFARKTYHIKNYDYPTLLWCGYDEAGEWEESNFERLVLPEVEKIVFINQARTPEFVINKKELRPLGSYKNH